MKVEEIIMVIKVDIKSNIMGNNKRIRIEYIIGKVDNDLNGDGSDWIGRVGGWCVDGMNEVKVVGKVDKKMKVRVINKIGKSKCCVIDEGVKVYDSNGCEVGRGDSSKYRCNDSECSGWCRGGEGEEESGEGGSDKKYVGMGDNCCGNGCRSREVIDSGKVGCNGVVYRVDKNSECGRCEDEVDCDCERGGGGYDKWNDKYIVIGGKSIEVNFNDSCIRVVYKDIESEYSDNYDCEVGVIGGNGKLIEGVGYYCMGGMVMRGYKDGVFNVCGSEYGSNGLYVWESMKKDIKSSILLDEESDDDSGWNELFYKFSFGK